MLITDGTHLTGTDPPIFRDLTAPSGSELQALVKQVSERLGRHFKRKGLSVRDYISIP